MITKHLKKTSVLNLGRQEARKIWINIALPWKASCCENAALKKRHDGDRAHCARTTAISPEQVLHNRQLFFDLLILDPPRAGCGPKLKDFVLTKPANIIYVSCHPYSLKKDAFLLNKEGYTIQNITAYNMFPGTEHVETLCSFTRTS